MTLSRFVARVAPSCHAHLHNRLSVCPPWHLFTLVQYHSHHAPLHFLHSHPRRLHTATALQVVVLSAYDVTYHKGGLRVACKAFAHRQRKTALRSVLWGRCFHAFNHSPFGEPLRALGDFDAVDDIFRGFDKSAHRQRLKLRAAIIRHARAACPCVEVRSLQSLSRCRLFRALCSRSRVRGFRLVGTVRGSRVVRCRCCRVRHIGSTTLHSHHRTATSGRRVCVLQIPAAWFRRLAQCRQIVNVFHLFC